jgi:hypothetical protein
MSNPKTGIVPAIKTDARVTGGALVVSVLGSEAPWVWRSDMSRLSVAAFEIREEGGACTLVLKTPEGVEKLHAFNDRSAAVAALNAVTRALFAQQGTAPVGAKPLSFWGKLLRTVGYLLAAMASLLVLWVFMHVRSPEQGRLPLMQSQKMGLTIPGHPEIKPGVPLPADQMLGK